MELVQTFAKMTMMCLLFISSVNEWQWKNNLYVMPHNNSMAFVLK